jgi:hypothetical protein
VKEQEQELKGAKIRAPRNKRVKECEWEHQGTPQLFHTSKQNKQINE